MTKSIYDLCLLYKCEPLNFVDLQTNNTLMLANVILATVNGEAMKIAKFMTKKQACLLPRTSIKFNDTWI